MNLYQGISLQNMEQEFVDFLYPLALLKLLYLRFHFGKIAYIFTYVDTTLRQNTEKRVQHLMKFVKVVLVFICILLPIFSIGALVEDLLKVRLDVCHMIFDTASIMFYHFGAIATDFMEEIIQFLFLICSLLIYFIFEQFTEDLRELNDCQDEKQIRKTIKKIVQLHENNINLIKNITGAYQWVLNMNFFSAMVILINSLLYVDGTNNLVWLILTTPLVMNDLWVYCFSCEIMKTAVNRLLHFQQRRK